MLISCPECSRKVSDKALACPGCGYPIASYVTAASSSPSASCSLARSSQPAASSIPVIPAAIPSASGRRRKKHKKLPNGFGSIQKLTGNRQRPYAAYPPTKEFHLNGSPVRQEALGYFETWYAAYDSLSEYNRLSDQEREELKRKNDVRSFTFSQIYEMYYQDKFKTVLRAEQECIKVKRPSLMNSVRAAYKNASSLHDIPFSTLRRKDFQEVVDSCPLKYSSKELIVMLFNQMSKFALQNDYIDKDYAQFVKIDEKNDDEQGQPFSVEAIRLLWQDSEDPVSQMILILIYSGFRISAFETMTIEDGCFRGGVKTSAGRNRLVPIHSAILPFIPVNPFLQNFSASAFRKIFYRKLDELGISYAGNAKHTPHDCRHTFSWLCDRFGVDETSKHLLMGHSLGGDVESRVYSHRTPEQLKYEIEKIRPDRN